MIYKICDNCVNLDILVSHKFVRHGVSLINLKIKHVIFMGVIKHKLKQYHYIIYFLLSNITTIPH